jgi:hypothetical protein
MRSVKVVFYLPLRDNDGRPLVGEIDDLEAELYLRFVGWTFLGYVKGVYRMADGSRARDESAAYAVILDENRLNELEELLRAFKKQTLQEAIYLEIQRDVEARFIS